MAKTDNVRQVDLPRATGGGPVYIRGGGAGGVSNADTVDGYHASSTPTAGKLLALDSSAQFNPSVIEWADVAGAGLSASGDTLVVQWGTTPTTIQPDDAAAGGSAATSARSDHRHAIATAVPGTILPDDSANEGSATSFARSDHRHAIAAAAPTSNLSATSTNAEGSSTSFARADHSHAITAYTDASVYPAHLLKSDASGHLKLVRLTATDRLRTSLVDSEEGTNLVLASAQDLDLQPGTARVRALSGVRLQADNYASQTTGWAVAYSGAADFRYVYTDELHAKAFVADLEQALAGGQIISKSVAPLSRDFTAPAPGSTAYLWVECFQGFPSAEVFATGDVVMVRNFDRSGGGLSITNCFGTVSSPYFPDPQSDPPEQRWTFTRLSGTVNGHPAGGYMGTSEVVKRGALALDFGTSDMGYHEVNAIDGLMGENSPYAQNVKWATHPWYDRTVVTRTGNLKGIFNVAGEYGLYAGTGVTDADQFVRISNQAVEAHNLPVKLYDGSNVAIMLQPSASPYIAMGVPIPTGWLTQSGWWAGKSDGVYRQYLGTISDGDITAGLKWDGTTLTVKGQIYVTGGDAAKTDLTNVDANTVVGKVNTTGATLIQPGRILISGGTTLDGWRHPTDTTKIDGGDIYTNSITADKINVGIGGGNLLTDSGFELGKHTATDISRLTVNTFATQTGGAHPPAFGSRLLTADNFDGPYGDHYFYLSEQIPVKEGEKITVSFWFRSAGAITQRRFFLKWSDGSHADPWNHDGGTSNWVRVWNTYTVPANVTWAQLRWGVYATDDFWFAVDNVQVEYGDYPTAWKSNTWSSVFIDGAGILVGTPRGTRVEINAEGIAGYSDLTTKQFYLDATTGRGTFGGGKGVLDASGLTLSGAETSYQTYNAIRWQTVTNPPGGDRVAELAAGLFTSSYPTVTLSANPSKTYSTGYSALVGYGNSLGQASVSADGSGNRGTVTISAIGSAGTAKITVQGDDSTSYMTFAIGLTTALQIYNNKNVWFYGDVSAASFTDRTPYPDKATALAAVRSLKQAEGKAGSLDHEALHEYVRARDEGGEMGRNLSATVSAQNVVIQELLERIELLEKDRRVS